MFDFLNQKQAKIYCPAKTATQSGKRNTKSWLLEFEQESSRFEEPIMGWTASRDTVQQLRLSFASLEAAISYAKQNSINYQLIQPKQNKLVKESHIKIL
ncbi:NADH-ubiquinone oxidoreductase [Rickettsiales bacterium]|nr:NADH-ubiquinone oxidoreductase [Rickettsiales bacterium]